MAYSLHRIAGEVRRGLSRTSGARRGRSRPRRHGGIGSILGEVRRTLRQRRHHRPRGRY